MSVNRLFQMIHILLERKTVTAAELARKFEISVRTVYRDVDTLSSAGIPIYTTRGKGGGISLLGNYILDKALLSAAEQENILAALNNIPDVSNEVGDLIMKLSALFQKTNTNWMEVDLSRWGNKEHDGEKFNILKESILNKYILTFSYISTSGIKTARVVKPIKLVFKSSAWYLQAFCLGKNDYRTFKISRMSQTAHTLEQFVETLSPPLVEEFVQPNQYPLLKLKFDKYLAYRIYDEFDDCDISFDNEDNLIVSVRMPEDMWLYSFLLSFGASVQVLEPVHIKHALAEEAKKIFKANS